MQWIWLFVAAIPIFSGCNRGRSAGNPADVEDSTVSTGGVDTVLLNGLADSIKSGFYPNIHSVLIARKGRVLYERYFPGEDENYGRDLGLVHHDSTTLHDVRSISKSVVSACIGIAINKGYIKDVEQKISGFFPDHAHLFTGEKAAWTIEHFLTMTTGLVWNEQVPYDDPANDEIRMTLSEEPVKYILSRPMNATPGTTFNYNGGATQILGAIVERTSGKRLDEFAKEYLFQPLAITGFEWNGYSLWNKSLREEMIAAPSGLRLRSVDLMKFGLLYRNQGEWNGRQIIPSSWIAESFTPKVSFPSNVAEGNDSYGYQFWMWPDVVQGKNVRIISATGNGDQHIYWDLDHDLVVVTTAGNYNQWNIPNDSYAILENVIYPALDMKAHDE